MRSLPSLLNLAVNRVLCLSANCWSFSLRTCLASSALHTTTFKAEPNQTETIGKGDSGYLLQSSHVRAQPLGLAHLEPSIAVVSVPAVIMFPTTGHGRGPGGSLNLSLRYRM
uniref:Secreted protein n=1 Tax=Salix viminalis TaxID=40686 RepID=A0A6N2N7L7_SALVM